MSNKYFQNDEETSKLEAPDSENLMMRPPDEDPFPPDYPPDDPPPPPPSGDQSSPTGVLDSVDSGYVSGWSYDPDNPNASNDVHIYIGGPAGSGAAGYAVTANQPRPDVNQAFGIGGDHGFSFQIPAQYADGQYYPVYAYGIDTGANNPALLNGCPKYFLMNPPAPAVSLNQVSPIAGTVVGGISITLTGSGFQTGAAVYFGNSPAPQVSVESGEVIRATLPASSNTGSVSVSVINPDGSSATLPGGFTYVASESGDQAEVIGITPLAVIEDTNTTVTIRGRNLIEAYNTGVLVLRGPSRCQITFLGTTTSHDVASGIDTVQMNVNIKCSPALQPLERMAIQVLASRRPEAANDGVVESSRQMFTVLPKAVPVTLAYTANLQAGQPNLVMVSGRNLDNHSLALNDGTQVAFQKNDGNFLSGIVMLPENADTSQPLQLSILDLGGTKVAEYRMDVMPDSGGYVSLNSEQSFASLAPGGGGDEFNLNLAPAPNQQFIGPTANDSAAFSVQSGSPFGFGFNFGNFAFTILDVTIILPIINEVYMIPFFDGGGDTFNSPVVAEVGKIFRLRGSGLLVALRVEVIIHIKVVLIIGFYYQIWDYGFYNEFPEFGWSIGSMVIDIRVQIDVIFLLTALVALIKPDGQAIVLAGFTLEFDIKFYNSPDGKLHLKFKDDYVPYVIGISPKKNEPMLCGGKFELLPRNGLAAVPDEFGFVAEYAVHEAGDCCLPWDYDVKLLRYDLEGREEVIQGGFQTTYCLTAQPSTDIEIEPVMMYSERDQSTGQIIKDNNGKTVLITANEIERMEPHEFTVSTPVKPVREYVLAARIKNPGVVNANGTYAVKVNVTMKTEDAGGNLVTNPLVVPNVSLAAPRSTLENDLKKFFSGSLADGVTGGTSTNSYKYSATLELNVTTVNKNEPIPFVMGEVYPNQIEESGKFVPPGEKVTKNKISLSFELAAPATNAGYSINSNNQLKRFVTNEETYEEYYRVFKEIRDVLHSGTANLANLSGFANNFQKELAKPSGGLSILESYGKNLWDFGVAYVQNAARDDRPLYYARLESLAVLRAYGKRKPVALTAAQIRLFEYPSRGFKTIIVNGKTEFQIQLVSQNDQNVIVTGFDPFSLNSFPNRSNTSGIIALGLNNKQVSFAKVQTAIFPVRWRDFDDGLVEQVMDKATANKSVSLIMTCSWTPEDYFRVDRFATRYRGGGTDNENEAAIAGASVTGGDAFLESSLPYDFPGLLTDQTGTTNKTLTNGSKLVLDQDYADSNWVEHLRFEIGKPNSYKKAETDLPSSGDELKSGSGGNYLSNEIFYRTAFSRKTNRPCLPTGHLHVRRLEAQPNSNPSLPPTLPAVSGDFILDGGRQSLELLLSGIRRIVFADTTVGSTNDETVTIYNNTSRPVQINSNNLSSLPDFELVAPLGNIDITAGGNKTLTFRFRPTAGAVSSGYAVLKNGSDILYCIELRGKGVYLPPTITAVRTSSPAASGTKITIEGTNFVNGMTQVKIGGVMVSPVIFINSTKVEVNLPTLPGGSTPNIEVITPGGSATIPGGFTVASRLPAFSSPAFSPSSGAAGTTIDIFGNAFDDVTDVKIGGISALFTKINSTQMRATIPSGATSSFIEVVTPDGTVTSSEHLTVIPTPVISSFSPSLGAVGETVVIYGQNFNGATEVRIGNSIPFTVISPTQITATITEYAYDSTIVVVTPGGTATSAEQFTLMPPPNVAFFSPQSGPMGTTVNIYGQNLGNAIGVRIGDAVIFDVVSQNQISALAPGVIGSFPIEVDTPGGTATTFDQFTVTFDRGGGEYPFPDTPIRNY